MKKLENKDVIVKYDFENDILYARKKGDKYSTSYDIGNFIFDLNAAMEVIGLEILSVSNLFHISKLAFQNMNEIELEIIIEESILSFKAVVQANIRNALRTSSVDIEKPQPIELVDSRLMMKLKRH